MDREYPSGNQKQPTRLVGMEESRCPARLLKPIYAAEEGSKEMPEKGAEKRGRQLEKAADGADYGC